MVGDLWHRQCDLFDLAMDGGDAVVQVVRFDDFPRCDADDVTGIHGVHVLRSYKHGCVAGDCICDMNPGLRWCGAVCYASNVTHEALTCLRAEDGQDAAATPDVQHDFASDLVCEFVHRALVMVSCVRVRV